VGSLQQVANDTKSAVENYHRSLALDESLLKEEPSNTFYQRAVAIDYTLLAFASIDAGNLGAAVDFQKKTIALYEQLVEEDPKNKNAQIDLSQGYSRTIEVLAKAGDISGARNYYEKSLAMVIPLLEKNPNNTVCLMNLRSDYMRMADLLLTTDEASVAIEDATKELALDDKILALNPANADARRNEGVAHEQLGKAHLLLASKSTKPVDRQHREWKAARDQFQQSLDIWNEIKRKNLLTADADKPDEIAREIAQCDAALK
jgi:tetratricopeptide (TPR) repeat protein